MSDCIYIDIDLFSLLIVNKGVIIESLFYVSGVVGGVVNVIILGIKDIIKDD